MVQQGSTDRLDGRAVSSGSVFSTVLIERAIGRLAPVGPAERVVDVGCGDSPYRQLVPARRYVGVDRRPSGARGEVVAGDVTGLPLATASADVVLCTEVIEHVGDERSLAAELARVAAPGARLVLSSPFVHGLHEQPYDYRRLTSIGLVRVLEGAGWRVDEVAAIGGPVVVTVDGAVRWADSTWRRIVRQGAPKGSAAFRCLTAPSGWLQRRLAGWAIARSSHLGAIDPMAPSPRLTLGYVVAATREGTPAVSPG